MTANGTAATMETMTPQQSVQSYFNDLPKEQAIDLAVRDIFLCLGRKSSSESRRLHVTLLAPLDVGLLVRGLSEALYTTNDWLSPGAVFELCMGGSRADLAAQEAEEAWAWMLRYIQNHGKDGHVKRGAFMGSDDRPIFAPDTPAPKIPEAIANVLGVLGGTPMRGVERIALTPTTELAWVKKEFVAGYVRAGRLG